MTGSSLCWSARLWRRLINCAQPMSEHLMMHLWDLHGPFERPSMQLGPAGKAIFCNIHLFLSITVQLHSLFIG